MKGETYVHIDGPSGSGNIQSTTENQGIACSDEVNDGLPCPLGEEEKRT